jgi:hypothetical protein
MFLRVEPGVYTFGSRKVNLRLELSKLKVRVGGGYISIDEFLDQYTPEELDRQKRHDPLAAKQRV